MRIKTNISIFFIIIIFSTLLTPQIIFSETNEQHRDLTPKAVKNWTFMLYFCADTRDEYVTSNQDNGQNWLGKAMLGVLNRLWMELILPGSHDNINIIALFDFPYAPQFPQGNAFLYEVRYNDLIVLQDWGATNMGSGITLTNFINFCKTNYPANNYALLLSDHGRGYAGFCYDYHAPHPSWEYALGDCLTVDELSTTIENTGWLDILFLDTCLGGSFEVMWQLADKVEYVVAGETIQKYEAMFHPQDLIYNMTRNPSATVYECAYFGFNAGANPVYVPMSPYYTYEWQNIGIYNLNKLNYLPTGGGDSISQVFDNFATYLHAELNNNETFAKQYFANIRSKLNYPSTIMSTQSMMVDMGDLLTTILENTTFLHYQAEIESTAVQLLDMITPGSGKYITDFFVDSSWHDDNITGFTICFPDSQDMYQEYLYPNFYYDLDISVQTSWDNFIFDLYDILNPAIFKHIPEYYEIHLGPIDPTIGLHVFIEIGQLRDPIHIGYSDPLKHTGMGIEIGLEAASFTDDLLHGTCTIRIPMASIPVATKSDPPVISVVVNASAAASTTQDVNLSVKHVEEGSVVWEDTKISEIEIGQVIGTNITANDDEWSDWEELAPPDKTPRFDGFEATTSIIAIGFTSSIVLLIIRRRRRNKL
ncbi:MAG: hypothetical protein FK733_01060 [Asgard group archaeon]|nr:hypothetical protein [Asgard group archaeon]